MMWDVMGMERNCVILRGRECGVAWRLDGIDKKEWEGIGSNEDCSIAGVLDYWLCRIVSEIIE